MPSRAKFNKHSVADEEGSFPTAVCGTAGSFGAEREDLNKSAEVASCAPGNRTLSYLVKERCFMKVFAWWV